MAKPRVRIKKARGQWIAYCSRCPGVFSFQRWLYAINWADFHILSHQFDDIVSQDA